MSIPFDIPVRLAARYLSGDLVRSGALLRHARTGRIVAHLQETAGLARLGNPLDLVARGVQIRQNEQIKAGLALVHDLGIANLALTGVGIGVSVVGFAVVAARLQRIEKGIDGLAEAIERVGRKVEGVRDHLVRQELADMRAELRRADLAWTQPEMEVQHRQWRRAADRLLTIEERFHGHARELAAVADEPRARDLMIDAYVLAAEGRRSALLAIGDEGSAEEAGRDLSRRLDGLTGPIGASDLLRERLSAEKPQGLAARADAVERLRGRAEADAATLREREAMAASAPLTIAALRRSGVSGRDWLERARGEKHAPLICLPVPEPTDGAGR